MTFGSHFLNLLSKRGILVGVTYGPSNGGGPDRKELARMLHEQVCRLAEESRPRRDGQLIGS